MLMMHHALDHFPAILESTTYNSDEMRLPHFSDFFHLRLRLNPRQFEANQSHPDKCEYVLGLLFDCQWSSESSTPHGCAWIHQLMVESPYTLVGIRQVSRVHVLEGKFPPKHEKNEVLGLKFPISVAANGKKQVGICIFFIKLTEVHSKTLQKWTWGSAPRPFLQ